MLNIFRPNKKAQVSAPFELLVAVVVMGFVILAGTYALSNLSENTCLGNKRQNFSEMISALRDVTLGSDLTFRNVTFTTKSCFNQKYEKIQLNTYEDEGKCNAYCGGGTNCLLLEYIYEDEDRMDYKYPIPPVCTHLPSAITFETDIERCVTDGGDEWDTINPIANDIPLGRYRIFRSNDNSQNNIKICFLKKK